MFDLFGKKRREQLERRRLLVEQNSEMRASARHALLAQVVTSIGPDVRGCRITKQVGAVFAKWHKDHPDDLSSEYYRPPHWDVELDLQVGDSLSPDALVDLSLRLKAAKLGATAVVRVRFRSFKNGCEASGDAVVIENQARQPNS